MVAVGGNREAARIAGVPVARIMFSVYVLSGICAGIAAVLLCAPARRAPRRSAATSTSSTRSRAVVIGGTSLAGGRATIVGTVLGVITFALIFSLMTQLNLSAEIQQVTKGVIVLGAVLLQRRSEAALLGARQVRQRGGGCSMSLKRLLVFIRRAVAARRSVSPHAATTAVTETATAPTAAAAGQPRRAVGDGPTSRSSPACRRPTTAGSAPSRRTRRPRPRSTTTSTFELLQAADADSQAQQIEQAIAEKPDALVVLPQDGAALTPVAQKAERAGIQVVNIDRLFTSAGRRDATIARRQLPDRRARGELHRRPAEVQRQRRRDPGPRRHLGDRASARKGFADTIKKKLPGGGIKIVAQQPADFNPDKGLTVMENILQAQKTIDAVYTHDDDMAQGVVQAIRNAGRADEMFLTGVGGSSRRDEADQGGRPLPRDLPLQPEHGRRPP